MVTTRAGLAVFGIGLALTLRDVLMSGGSDGGGSSGFAEASSEPLSDSSYASAPKMKSAFVGPTLKFLYCYS